MNTDHKDYATTLYRLYKIKASIYSARGSQLEFEENTNLAMEALMRASKHYDLLSKSKYAFLNQLNQQERFLLLTRTDFFRVAKAPYLKVLGISFANLTMAYTMLSRYYTENGNLSMSLEYSELAINEAKKNGDRDLIAWAYNRALGYRHFAFGFFDLAEKEYMTSLQYCRFSADGCRWGAQFSMAVCQYHLGEYETAEKSLKKMKTVTDLNHSGSLRQMYIRHRLGLIYLEQKKFQQAIPLLRRTYKDFKRVKKNPYLLQPTKSFRAGLALCRAYISLGMYDEATNLLNQIKGEMSDVDILLTRELDFKLTQSELFQNLNMDPSIPLLQAIEMLELVRPTAGNSRDYEYWIRKLKIYNRTVDFLFDKNDIQTALEIAEKARSRQFLDHIGSKHMGAKGKAGYLLSQQVHDSLEFLSLIERDMLQSAKNSGIKVRKIYHEGTRYSKSLTAVRKKYIKTAAIDPQFESIYNIKPIEIDNVQKNIPEDVAIIEYYLSENALYTWVITQQNVFAHKQQISEERITALIKNLRLAVSKPSSIRGITIERTEIASENKEHIQLYDILVAPIESHIDVKRIGIVPYGVLNYLPFQALCDGEHFMIEKYAISYIPSLSVLKYIKSREFQGPITILAFGNPKLGDSVFDLPAAEKEVTVIQTLFPSTTVLKRTNASEANVKNLADQYTNIHFASHGEYRPEAPLSSCLRLAPGNGEDGRLEASEVFDLNLNADMVVTSACQTAIGKIREGDEIVGLNRAFIYAGARSVLGSLWNISDDATAEFMRLFYSNIQALGKVEALRQAQLKMITSEKYHHPFYWAAFNMTGGL
jgi:CHAT domain-containing protein